jgi:hypothetical protein
MVTTSQTAIRAVSVRLGTMPRRRMPTPATRTVSAVSIKAITARPAANLPLITSSR